MFSLKKRPGGLRKIYGGVALFVSCLPSMDKSMSCLPIFITSYPKAKEQARKRLAAAAAGESIADLEERHIFMI